MSTTTKILLKHPGKLDRFFVFTNLPSQPKPLTVFQALYDAGEMENSFDVSTISPSAEPGVDFVVEVDGNRDTRARDRKRILVEHLHQEDVIIETRRIAEAALQVAQESQQAAQESRRAAQESQQAAQESRRAAEESRQAAEESRQAAEESRQAAEESRRAAEESRRAAEEVRRVVDENRRVADENRRATKESRRIAEAALQAAEEIQRAALRTAEHQSSKAKRRVQDLDVVLTSQSIDNIVQALNDIIYHTKPRPGPRGIEVLDAYDIGYLKYHNIGYITHLVDWDPSEPYGIYLKQKAYDCLTQDQQHLMHLFTDKRVYNYQCQRRNILQHSLPSLQTVQKVAHALHDYGLLRDLNFKALLNFLESAPVTLKGEDLFVSGEDELELEHNVLQYWTEETARLKVVLGF